MIFRVSDTQCFHDNNRIQITMQMVMTPESKARMMPTFIPSFLMSVFMVIQVCSQSATVPITNASRAPMLCTVGSTEN